VPPIDIAHAEPHVTLATMNGPMDHRDDARAEELNNLRLALATFALQLDAFEMRVSEGLLRVGKTGILSRGPSLAAGRGQAREGENDWASIKSPGNKSDA
jgi:hypothetical protein